MARRAVQAVVAAGGRGGRRVPPERRRSPAGGRVGRAGRADDRRQPRRRGRRLRVRLRPLAAARSSRTSSASASSRRARRSSTSARRRATRASRPRRCPRGSTSATRSTASPTSRARGFKVAPDRHGPPFDPDTGERGHAARRWPRSREFVGRRFPALTDAPLVASEVCQYENTSNGDFLIDRHPELENVWLVGGGSGHGFKHGPAVGEYVAARILRGRQGRGALQARDEGQGPEAGGVLKRATRPGASSFRGQPGDPLIVAAQENPRRRPFPSRRHANPNPL